MADCTGVISQMFIYPVKSCAGIEVSEAILSPAGLSHDREWLIVDQDGQFVTQRQIPHMVWITPRLTRDALFLSAPGQQEIRIPFSLSGATKQVTVWRDTWTATIWETRRRNGWINFWPYRANTTV